MSKNIINYIASIISECFLPAARLTYILLSLFCLTRTGVLNLRVKLIKLRLRNHSAAQLREPDRDSINR